MSNLGDQRRSPAIDVVELASLARAAVVLDAIVNRSPVALHTTQRVSPGKYLIVFRGGIAEVEEGFDAALKAAAGVLVDRLILPQAHDQIHDALEHRYPNDEIDSLGLFETYTAASAVLSLDAALKATEVDLAGLHLCAGIGGKGYWVLSGPLHLVQEAISVASASVEADRIVSAEVIPRPHEEAIAAYLEVFRGT